MKTVPAARLAMPAAARDCVPLTTTASFRRSVFQRRVTRCVGKTTTALLVTFVSEEYVRAVAVQTNSATPPRHVWRTNAEIYVKISLFADPTPNVKWSTTGHRAVALKLTFLIRHRTVVASETILFVSTETTVTKDPLVWTRDAFQSVMATWIAAIMRSALKDGA